VQHSDPEQPEETLQPTQVLSELDLIPAEPAAPIDLLPKGTLIGQYRIEGVLGAGGGGTVYEATHQHLGRRVAIKVLSREMAAFPTMIARFVQEARAVNMIRHANIVDIFEFGELGPNRPYYVMELLEGRDLRLLLRIKGRFTPAEAFELLEPVCDALAAAHAVHIIHRDIKANNVLVTEARGKRAVKLLDFGIAKILHGEPGAAGLTEPGMMLGSAHHMAPEQIRGLAVDERTDVYAMGVLIFQLVTGQYPFFGDGPRQVQLLHLQAPAPRPSTLAPVSPALDALVLKCLEKAPNQRFSSIKELASEFRKAVYEPTGVASLARREGAAIYFEVLTNSSELDDDEIEDLNAVFDAIETRLGAQDYTFPLRTFDALLAVQMSPPALNGANAADSAAEVHALLATLQQRPTRQPRLQGRASLATGEVTVDDRGEVTGGELLEVNRWGEDSRIGTF